MTDAIDAMVDAAAAEINPEPAVEQPAAEEIPAEQPAAEEKPAQEEAFPKKAVNAISRRDKKIGKLQEQIRQLKQEQLQNSKNSATTESGSAPRLEDFNSYDEFVVAAAEYAANKAHQTQRSEDAKRRDEETTLQLNEASAALRRARAEVVNESAMQAQAAFSDFGNVVDSVSVMVEGKPMLPLNETAKEAFYEAGEDAAFALYSLAKEGSLEDLNDMSLARAAMVVARHVEKGKALANTKKESTAPAPVSRPTGTGSGQKHPADMSAKEVMAWVNS